MEFDFKTAEKLADDVYSILFIAEFFCKEYLSGVETCDSVIPLIAMAKRNASRLDVMLINYNGWG